MLSAINQGFGIECDVRQTLDQIPVISHDDDLSRTRGIKLLISQTKFADLNQALSGSASPICSLEQVVNQVLPRALINFNIKTEPAVAPTLAVLSQAPAGVRYFLSGHSVASVRQLAIAHSDSAYVHSWTPWALFQATRAGVKAIVTRNWLVNRPAIKLAIWLGFKVYLWGQFKSAGWAEQNQISGLIKDI